jgi:hypothetical protein
MKWIVQLILPRLGIKGYKMFYEINHWTHTEEMVLCLGNPSNENNVLSNAFIE